MRDVVRAAAVAVDSRPESTSENLEKMAVWAGRAADSGADLVLFPELSACGFLPNHPESSHDAWLRAALRIAWKVAEPLDGPIVHRLTEIARRYRVLLSAGMLEAAGAVLHNTQILVGPEGLIGRWRKLHIPMYEMPFYVGGDGVEPVDTPLGRIGCNVCFDVLIPESTRLLSARGLEIGLFPFAADPAPGTCDAWAAWARPALQGRCVENGIFGLACNYVGQVACAGAEQAFPGGGIAIGPRGETLCEWAGTTGEPAMMVAEFRAEQLLDARSEPEYLFRFRRPEIYGPLTRSFDGQGGKIP